MVKLRYMTDRSMRTEGLTDIAVLTIGSGIASAIPVAVSPILTRIYSPEDFGMLSLYLSIVSICSTFTMMYSSATLLPRRENHAFHLVVLSVCISLLAGLISAVVVVPLNSEIAALFGYSGMSSWLYLFPFSIFLMGGLYALRFWGNRRRIYYEMAKGKISYAMGMSAIQLGLGSLHLGRGGLILGEVVGRMLWFLVLGLYLVGDGQWRATRVSGRRLIGLARRFQRFPKLAMPAKIVTVFADQLPVFVLARFFSVAWLGFYALADRVFSALLGLIGQSFQTVFNERASSEYREKGHCMDAYRWAFRMLIGLSLPPTLLLACFGPWAYSTVFGVDWRVAGEFAQILSVMFFFKFVAFPLGYVFSITGRQDRELVLRVALLITNAMSLLIGAYLSDIVLSLKLLSAGNAFVFSAHCFMTYAYSRERSGTARGKCAKACL